MAVTDRCNLKCIHCDIWQKKKKNDITLSLIHKILDSRALPKDVDIAITGGEPFLHRHLGNITEVLLNKRQGCLKTISTNGVLKNRILNFLKKFYGRLPSDFSLHISFDGMNLYEKQRKVSPKKVLSTINSIKKLYPDLSLKLKFTVTPLNYGDILPTYEFAARNGLGFKIKVVEQAVAYTNSIAKKAFSFKKHEKRKITQDLLYLHKNEKSPKESEFIKRSIGFLEGLKQKSSCPTPLQRLFIMPDGAVYSCLHLQQIGDLKKTELAAIYNSKQNKENTTKAIKGGCGGCVAYHGYSIS